MELGLLSLNPPNVSFLRVLKRALEEGINLVAIPLILSSSRLSTISMFSSSFEQAKILRILSDFIFKKVPGRDMRCSQSLKFNEARQVKYAIDMGSFVIVV